MDAGGWSSLAMPLRYIEAGTHGIVYFDDFESRRFSYIGTLLDPGVYDPQAINQAGWVAYTYSYTGSQPHAVTALDIEGGSTNSYEYDNNGNMTCRTENGITWKQDFNAENRISAIHRMTGGNCSTGTADESWTYTYDGDGVRVSTAHFTAAIPTPQTFTAYYAGGSFEVTGSFENMTFTPDITKTKSYYAIAGMMVAMKDNTGVKYLLTDHLGSVVATTNASGTLTSQQRYLPFGGVRTDIDDLDGLPTNFTYTGQRDLPGTGLMDYKARFYSPYHNLDGL